MSEKLKTPELKKQLVLAGSQIVGDLKNAFSTMLDHWLRAIGGYKKEGK